MDNNQQERKLTAKENIKKGLIKDLTDMAQSCFLNRLISRDVFEENASRRLDIYLSAFPIVPAPQPSGITAEPEYTPEFKSWLDKYFALQGEVYISKAHPNDAYEHWELEYKYRRAVHESPFKPAQLSPEKQTKLSAEEIRNRIAIENGYLTWQELLKDNVIAGLFGALQKVEDRATEEYAKQFATRPAHTGEITEEKIEDET